jgi:nitrite reductase/ring-hydroxylating ferredoxin subunit
MEILLTNRNAVSDTEVRAFAVGRREIVLCEVDGEIYALDAICTHEDLPLDGGEVEDGIIECPWHGARYEACTGKVRALPATRPLQTFGVRVDEQGNVFVEVPEER